MDTVVITPIKRFVQAKTTKAVLGTLNMKLAGYMRGILAHLNEEIYKFRILDLIPR